MCLLQIFSTVNTIEKEFEDDFMKVQMHIRNFESETEIETHELASDDPTSPHFQNFRPLIKSKILDLAGNLPEGRLGNLSLRFSEEHAHKLKELKEMREGSRVKMGGRIRRKTSLSFIENLYIPGVNDF